MLNFLFGDKKKKLQKEHAHILTKAMQAQRNGNLKLFADLTDKAQKIQKQIDEIKDK